MIQINNEKLHNMINDPNLYFYLQATPKLIDMIKDNTHPDIVGLKDEVKEAFLSDRVFIIHKEDIEKYVKGTLPEKESFLLSLGDIRVANQPNIQVSSASR